MVKDDKGKIKMTVIHFETESSNEALQENIRQIANTLTRALSPPPRMVHASPQLMSGNGTSSEQVPEADNYDDAIEAEATTPVAKPKKSGAARQYPKPEALDLDLSSGDVSLKEFLEQKNPDVDTKRYLAIAYWFKHYRETPEITMDHAYTAYRFMGWQVPKDVGGPFRSMKRKDYGWIGAGAERGTYAINHIGENVVTQMGKE